MTPGHYSTGVISLLYTGQFSGCVLCVLFAKLAGQFSGCALCVLFATTKKSTFYLRASYYLARFRTQTTRSTTHDGM
jgi:hypothetical protein